MLLLLAHSRLARWLLPWMFAHMSHLIPLKRLHESATLVAFYHPRPAYPLHILIVPKRAIPGLEAIQAIDLDFASDLFICVRSLVSELELNREGYRLIANGGRYQEVPLLHFHLISGTPFSGPS